MADQIVEGQQWLHNELNGAVAFIVLTTFFVTLRCVGVGVFRSDQKAVHTPSWDTILLLASWLAFIPMCIAAIGDERRSENFKYF